jgi:DNA (cytosine-5)-methyltransferase 1
MERGEIDMAPVWDDVRTLSKSQLDCQIDIISGGFPCTDLSLAGLRKGLGADRSGLFWEIVRLTKEIRPSIVFLENVWPGVRKFVPTIRAAFETIGYDVRDGFIAASDIGAPHERKRWFLVAYAGQESLSSLFMAGGSAANACEVGRERLRHDDKDSEHEKKESALAALLERDDWDEAAKLLCGMDHGVPLRDYAIGALGDSVVVQQARAAFQVLTGLTLPA